MSPYEIILTIVFGTQIAIGALGNSFLIYLFTIMIFTGQRMRIIDRILVQLAWANFLMIISKSIPQTMAAVNLKIFLNDHGCKFFFYLPRVSRGLSLSMTCLLSSFQAITISPRNSRWAELKGRAPEHLIPTCSLCWIFHLLLNILVLEKIEGPRMAGNISNILPYGYCSTPVATTVNASLFVVMVSLPDVVCVGLMVFTSGYMVLLLCKHHQQIQHIHMTSLSARASPESRATQSILLLASTFVAFYSLNSILAAYAHFRKAGPWLVHSSTFLSTCFPTFSPFVLISADSQVLKYYSALWGRNKLHFGGPSLYL
ncbi:vomeronasal type-1 receptor 4-like [Dromiciops gliroides]|uniref:vomeronasal type-1 receptor 4-like n=1 Tax=Dromiciops gliroides TaxID=33562 RepID=UPI001CC3EC6C|nr:vomeronasal type-1 receptor 4-like [Dromiciops gliroides]